MPAYRMLASAWRHPRSRYSCSTLPLTVFSTTLNIYMYIWLHTYVYTYIRTCKYVYIYKYTHTRARVHTHTPVIDINRISAGVAITLGDETPLLHHYFVVAFYRSAKCVSIRTFVLVNTSIFEWIRQYLHFCTSVGVSSHSLLHDYFLNPFYYNYFFARLY